MIAYRFSDEDLLRIRFAISPLHELIQSVLALRDPSRAALHLPWIRRVRGRVADLDLAPLEALVASASGYQPDFVAPPPESPLPDVEAEILRIRSTPRQQIRYELAEAYPDVPLPGALAPLLARPREALADLAGLLAEYWKRAIEPWWDDIRHALEDDIAHRARMLTTGGAVEVFADLHPDVSWREGTLEVRRPYDQTVVLAGRGMLLVPSVFTWPASGALWDPPWQPAMIYPARGVGNLWAPSRRDPQALGDLIGPRRARILAGLDREASTTAIARRLGASAGGVSEHLSVLRRAGLVRARRQGREVLYSRTPAGDSLLDAGT